VAALILGQFDGGGVFTRAGKFVVVVNRHATRALARLVARARWRSAGGARLGLQRFAGLITMARLEYNPNSVVLAIAGVK
jgi:hypothetical protein